jgi:ADP-ribose pyrophosphatase
MTKPSLADPALADAPSDATVSAPEVLVKSFRSLERYRITLRHADGRATAFTRDVLHVGPVVGVLAIDPSRNVIVLIRQFRLAAHLALGLGELVEIVAGHVEHGETAEEAARRECWEEIGVNPRTLHPILRFMPAPGVNNEHTTMFVGIVDSSAVPERAGAATETEDTQPICVDIETALAALDQGKVHNGYLIIALQWLALNRDKLETIAATTE